MWSSSFVLVEFSLLFLFLFNVIPFSFLGVVRIWKGGAFPFFLSFFPPFFFFLGMFMSDMAS